MPYTLEPVSSYTWFRFAKVCTPYDRLFMYWHVLSPAVLMRTVECHCACLDQTFNGSSKRLVENVVPDN
jgi:hypothetical protein